ncbi:piggyBac transposable element-derived protein 4-like [Hyperolius riggenbachi]|uniref:piggyBac transposable element-derived protein 4-like n=1 Tax=Hyperolius riggenbachi TaxID=752182 RepID=UPI0035A27B02
MAKRHYTVEEALAILQTSSTSEEESGEESGTDWLPDNESLTGSDSSSEYTGPPAKKVVRGVQSAIAVPAISSDSGDEGPSNLIERRTAGSLAGTSGDNEDGPGAVRQTTQPRVPEGDDVPRDNTHLLWFPANMEEPSIPPFTAASGILVDTSDMTPLDYFQLFLTESFLQDIVDQTNIYAEQFSAANPTAYYTFKWKPTTVPELKVFLGLTFNMGLTHKPQLRLYWCKDSIHSMPIYQATMTRGRYEQLMRFLHFNNNANAVKRSDPSFDRLFKLRPLLNHLNQKFPEVYMPGREIVVDESLVPFHGRLAMKQYIPSKRARYGVKLYKLCESGTGYTYSFRVYEGKDSSLEPAGCPPDMGTSGKIVVDLVNPLLHKGYHLYVDNFYSGVPLFKFLYTAQTMACGTVRLNRKGLPSQVLNKKLKRGESCSLRSNELLSLKYKDKRDVLMLSTIHTEATMTCQSRRQQIQKPVAIAEYSQYMGAVDFSDQMMAPYLILRKTRAWYKKVGIYLLQMAMYNSYVIFKKSGHGDSYLKFQEQIITSHPNRILKEDVKFVANIT